MPRNGSGTYSLPQPPFVAGTVISSAAVNSDFSDIATALTASLPRDGQAGMSGQFKAVDGSSVAPSISFTNEPSTGFYHEAAGEIGIVIEGTQVGTITSTGIAGTVPVGAILDYSGTTIPSLWYLCYGQAVNRTTYSILFNAIGTTYGSGDGSTTFNLPDYRGRTLVGLDNMGGTAAGILTSTFYGANPDVLGINGGAQSLTLAAANIPTITSSVSVSVSVSGSVSVNTLIGNGGGTVNTVNTSFLNGVGPAVNFPGSGSFSGSGSGSGSAASNNTGSTAHTLVQPSATTNKIIYAGA